MEGQKGKPSSRKLFFSMAPLRARIEESLHKLGDKLKSTKRRIPEDEESNGQQSKQARTTPSSRADALRVALGHAFDGQPRSLIDLTSNPPVDALATKASSSTSGASSSNPIDLTSSSTPSTPPSQISPDDGAFDPVNGQVVFDARLAKALQDQWDRETVDADLEAGLMGSTISTLAIYRDHISGLRCNKCRAAISLDWGKLVTRTKNAVKTEGFLHSYLPCASCKMWSCAGIGCHSYQRSIPSGPSPSMCSGTGEGSGLKVSWCCDGGREFLAFALCCGPESPPGLSVTESISALGRRMRPKLKSESAVPAEAQPNDSAMASPPTKPSKLQKNRAPKHAPALSKGIGYGGSDNPHNPFNSILSSKAKTPPVSEEPEVGLYFTALSLILPSADRERPTAFDLGPQARLKFMISRSPMFFKALQLLRQSCMEELASEQSSSPYAKALDFAIALTKHADLLPLLHDEAVLYPTEEHLGPLTFIQELPDSPALTPESRHISASSSDTEKTKSMDSLLQGFARQCEIFVKKASAHLDDFKSPEDQAMLNRAQRAIDTANSVAALRPVADDSPPDPKSEATSSGPGSSSRIITRSRSAKQALNAEMEKATSQSTAFHREHCVVELPDEQILKDHHFALQARAMESLGAQPAKGGRMKKLVTQVVSLRENLPYGIYVRYGESRMDVMKVLMVGPIDTPYQDGLFEFDLFCPPDFPATPPEMHFRTTGMGTIGFNPNLYNNGRVCLSLLGTWSGQAWEPNQSTILQVLVSIQGMILNSQPWYNEPGRENRLEDAASKNYNKMIWGYTVRHAMIYWLNERLKQPDAKGKGRKVPAPATIGSRPVTPASSTPPVSGSAADHAITQSAPAATTATSPPAPVPLINKAVQPKASIPWPKSPLHKVSSAVKEHLLAKAAKEKGPVSFGPSAPPLPPGLASELLPSGLANQHAQHLSEIYDLIMANSTVVGQQPMMISVRGSPTYQSTLVHSDDSTWGLVIRSHFTFRGPLILNHARQSPYSTDSKLLGDLQQALEKHGFHESA